MAKLSPDIIKWILSIDSSQAHAEIHKLEKENKELERQNKANQKAMAALAAQKTPRCVRGLPETS